MKENQYIAPAIRLATLEASQMLTASLTGTNTEGLGVSSEAYEDEGRVKSERSDYNVWDEDWGK